MDKRLSKTKFLGGNTYSIADMATYPWVKINDFHEIDLDQYPNVKRWRKVVGARPAVKRGCAVLEDVMILGNPDKEAFKNLFTRQKTI